MMVGIESESVKQRASLMPLRRQGRQHYARCHEHEGRKTRWLLRRRSTYADARGGWIAGSGYGDGDRGLHWEHKIRAAVLSL